MNNLIRKLASGLSRLGIALARERMRRELMSIDQQLLARAGLTPQSVIDGMRLPHAVHDSALQIVDTPSADDDRRLAA